MKLYKLSSRVYIEHNQIVYQTDTPWDQLVNRPGLFSLLETELPGFEISHSFSAIQSFDPPVSRQEIWASGVTYLRSREARMAESKDAGGGDFYDRVYTADRPELFFKSTPHRAVGHQGDIYIRHDSSWNVPEPELTLFISSLGTIEGYTIGNDVSSRSIEGENPLYLPQAKTYDKSAALGPCLWVPEKPISRETTITLRIIRKGMEAFCDTVSLSRMKRSPEELCQWLFRELTFPYGCYLMTGTGIVPPDEFTLEAGDEVRISIDGIGTLINQVAKRILP